MLGKTEYEYTYKYCIMLKEDHVLLELPFNGRTRKPPCSRMY